MRNSETLVLFTIAIEPSHFCLTFEDFCLGLTFLHGPRDQKRFGRAEKLGLGTREGAAKGPNTRLPSFFYLC